MSNEQEAQAAIERYNGYELQGRAEKNRFHIATMCRVLDVSTQGYYAWRKRPTCPHARRDAHLLAEIQRIYDHSRQTYGAPRVHVELIACGYICGHNRVARLMRNRGLVGRCGRRRSPTTTRRSCPEPVVADLVKRRFGVDRPNAVWAADITYVSTWEGWLYLAVLLDLYSRAIVGWAMADHLRTQLVLDALNMARTRRRPPAGLIHHSDRGSQYLSADYQTQLRAWHIKPSAGRVGVCWDNAVVESFFATLKLELIYRRPWPTRAAARTAIYEYIEVFYNRQRRHSALNYHTPAQHHALWTPTSAAPATT